MTRAAFRDLSNTPQRGLPIRQHKPGVLQPKSQQQPQQQPQQQQRQAAWCHSLANPSPALGVGAVQLQPSAGSAGSASSQVARLRFSGGTPGENAPPLSAQDPLSLLAPVSRSPPGVSPARHDLQGQQQQQNGALVRDFRRISAATASLAPASPAETLNATQSALESCIRELDGIMPNLSTSDASLVEESATASPFEKSAVAYSPAQTEEIAVAHASPVSCGWFPAASNARGAVIPSPDPPPPLSAEAEQGRLVGKSLPLTVHEDVGASPCSGSVDAQQPSLARKSDGHQAARRSSALSAASLGAQHDTDKAVATLGDAMHRLQKELSLLGQELKTPRPSAVCSPASSSALNSELALAESNASLVVWPGSPCSTPRRHGPAGAASSRYGLSYPCLCVCVCVCVFVFVRVYI